jgi:hypothetical protein
MCFPLVAGVYAAHLFLSGYNSFYYDSDGYWRLGHSFVRNGHFSLLNYDNSGRGYSLPLVNHVLQVIASDVGAGSVTIVKLFGSLLAATLGVIVLPLLARRLFPGASIGLGRVLALNALLFLFWRDHFGFPLSDFPSLLLASIGVLGLLRATAPGYLVAGIGIGLATNMRPAYQPALLAALAVAVLVPYRPWVWRRRGVAAGLVVAGALVAGLPQVLINHHQPGGSLSPFVPTAKFTLLRQFSDGMLAQKYDTYVGSPTGYPRPEAFYLDPATTHVLQEEHISTTATYIGQFAEITSYGQYARLIVHHPVAMVTSYVRHLFNGLDVRYPTPYLRDLRSTSIFLSLLQYTLMFLAIARLVVPEARRELGRVRWAGVVVLVSACLTVITGAVEVRYLLPLQVLIYTLVCFSPATWASLLSGSLNRRVGLAASYVAFVLVCLTLSSATLAQLQHPGPTLGLGGERSGSLGAVSA